jgi:hypothetical protein
VRVEDAFSILGFGHCGLGEIIISEWAIPEELRDLIGSELSPLYELARTTAEDGEEAISITYDPYFAGGC